MLKSYLKELLCTWAWQWMPTIPATLEAKPGEMWIWDKPGLHHKTSFQKQTKNPLWLTEVNLSSLLGYFVNPTDKHYEEKVHRDPLWSPSSLSFYLASESVNMQPPTLETRLGFTRRAAMMSKWCQAQGQAFAHLASLSSGKGLMLQINASLQQAAFHSPISTEVMLISRRGLALASSFSRGGWRRLAACCCQDTEHGHGSINGSQPKRMQEIKHLFSRYQGFIGEYCSWKLSKDSLNGSNSISQWKNHLWLQVTLQMPAVCRTCLEEH